MARSGERARLSGVIPITVIVAAAIICIVVSAWTSANRADEVALEHEKRLFSRSLVDHAERILRELESVTTSPEALRSLRGRPDREQIQNQIGQRLTNFFDHDFVFVVDAADNLVYALLGANSVEPRLFNSLLPDLLPALGYMRGRAGAKPGGGALRIIGAARGEGRSEQLQRAALIQQFLGGAALVAATMVASPDPGLSAADRAATPMVLTVKLIDHEVLAEIAGRLQLQNLRNADALALADGDFIFEITDEAGARVERFAWTPKRPGAEIVQSVIPFISFAFASFMLLSGLFFGYMRRTAVMIEAGENRLRHLALHDPLCGLPNRNFFSETLEVVMAEIRGGAVPAAVFYIDLDHFKDVNDTLGHHIGDDLICNVTARLAGTLRAEDLVARLGGDEFAVITKIATDKLTLKSIADRIITALCAPYATSGHNIVIGASIGIAVIDRDTQGDAADIMRYADMALYRAKNEGRNRACIYDAAMDADLSNRKSVEGDLRAALENGGLRLVYQPIVNASGEKVLGVEALLRWRHPERGELEPAQFIPIAEHSGLIIELGEWVLRRACLDSKTWPGLTVAVNVSPIQFRRLDFVQRVETILAEVEFDPSRLEIELTETTLLGNVESALTAMRRLKALGVRLALDDFGTGYSSLAYLRRFPFNKLKIDRSFVRSLEQAPDAGAIVHAIVGLGRGLGMKVTAEGVETAEQHLFLRAAGVHCMQGYRFGKPESPLHISVRLATPGTYRSIESDAAAIAG